MTTLLELVQQNIIQPHLRLIDLIALTKTSKALSLNINPHKILLYNPVNAIKKLLFDMCGFETVNKIIAQSIHRMLDDNTMMSGSIILQFLYTPMKFILSDEYDLSELDFIADDIDVFSNNNDGLNIRYLFRNKNSSILIEGCNIHSDDSGGVDCSTSKKKQSSISESKH
jgi:hypothetical protein